MTQNRRLLVRSHSASLSLDPSHFSIHHNKKIVYARQSLALREDCCVQIVIISFFFLRSLRCQITFNTVNTIY